MRHSVASLRASSLLAARVGAPMAVLGAQSGLAPNVRLPPFADATYQVQITNKSGSSRLLDHPARICACP